MRSPSGPLRAAMLLGWHVLGHTRIATTLVGRDGRGSAGRMRSRKVTSALSMLLKPSFGMLLSHAVRKR